MQQHRYALVPHRHIAASKDLRLADERYVTIGQMAVVNRVECSTPELQELLLCDVENQRVKLLEFTRENVESQSQESDSSSVGQKGHQQAQLRLRIASITDCLGWPCAAVVMPAASGERSRVVVLETTRHRVVQSHFNLVVSVYTLNGRQSTNFLQVPPGSRSVPSGSSGSSMEHSSFEDDASTPSSAASGVPPLNLVLEQASPLVLQDGDASWFGSMHLVSNGSAPPTVVAGAFGFDRLYMLSDAGVPRILSIRSQLRMQLDVYDFTFSPATGLYGVLLADETVRIYSSNWSLIQELKIPRAKRSSSRRSEEPPLNDVANSYKILITPDRKLLVAQLGSSSVLCFDATNGEYHGVVAGDIIVVCWAATDNREIFIYDLLTKFVVSYVLVKHVRRQHSQLQLQPESLTPTHALLQNGESTPDAAFASN